jgi:hypothetical protein
MPTLQHNALVEMFRDNPELGPRLLATLFHIDVPPHASVNVVEASLDQLVPIEFRADLVLELRDEKGESVLAIVLEVQRDKDPDKKYSWPVYVAVVRATKRCRTVVLVVTPDDDVAAWAAEEIDLGIGRGTLRPLVLGPAVVPEITDPAIAKQETELAVLSAVAHGNGPNGLAVVLAAFAALERLDREHAAAYFETVYRVLRRPMQKAVEAKIMEKQTDPYPELQYTWEKRFAELFEERGRLEGLRDGRLEGLRDGRLEGLRDGRLEGLRDGRLEGLRDGRLEGLRDALLRLAERKGIALGEADRARIAACNDAAALERWFDNVLGAKSASDVFSG